jgi:hypothetical protein
MQGSITFKFEVEPDLAVVDIDVRITATELRTAVSGVQGFRICVCPLKSIDSDLNELRARCTSRFQSPVRRGGWIKRRQEAEIGRRQPIIILQGYGVVTIELEKAISMSWAFPIKVQSVMLLEIR